MKTVHHFEDVVATKNFAEKLGQKLKGGEMIELISDIGGGKTTFVTGLAKGAGSKDKVSSPTFTISNLYQTPNFNIHHFDFYRLQGPGIIRHELEENIDDASDVVVVEWSNIVEDVLPEKRVVIHIKATGEESREISVSAPEELDYLA